jgi:hypothetical protein
MKTQNNFGLLEEVVDDKSTANVIRKANKKLKEIELLKKKESLSEEEKEKVKMEEFWMSFVKPKQKPIPSNKYSIRHSLCKNKKIGEEARKEGDYECPICFDPVPKTDIVATNCNHLFCKMCITSVVNHSISHTINCSLCRTRITNYDFQTEDNRYEIMNLLVSQGNKKTVLNHLDDYPYRTYGYHDPGTSIIFSQNIQRNFMTVV